jgi:dGTPase
MKYFKNRESLESRERDCLAEYAQLAAQSRGRQHTEPEHEYRTCYQRDRDRIIHSAAFRRLEAKTQVFFDPASDYYRTRLTHTMEVAQIARTMARILSLNEDLAEAAALAHDLGHPPYGHSGEAVLNELMAQEGGFEHNAQSLRIVEYLEHPYPAFRGLNLTYETRECLAKHETRYDQPKISGEYESGWGLLEGQIADLADAIAYNSHDLDDALMVGLVSEDDLSQVQLYQVLKGEIEAQFPDAKRLARQLRCAKGLIDLLVMDALGETARRLEKHKPENTTQIRSAPVKLFGLSEQGKKQLIELEKFLHESVYEHPQVLQAQKRARAELNFLFNLYLKDPTRLPQRYQQRLDEQGRERVICDYLAGMTDRFCHNLYEQMRL